MGATDYTEMPGYPTEELDITTGESTATRQFQCDWGDRYDVRDYLLSYDTGLYEYDTLLLPIKSSIVPFGDKNLAESALNKKSLYDKALITINYKATVGYPSNPAGENNITGAEFVSQSISIESQFLSVTSGTLYWDDTLTKAIDDGQAPEKLVQFKKFAITLHRVTYMPKELDTLIGTINIAAYEVVKFLNGAGAVEEELYTKAIGNMLYEGYNISRSWTGLGIESSDVTLNFSEIMNGVAQDAWNYFWNPDTQAWSKIYKDVAGTGTAVEIYTKASWTKLGLPPAYVEE